MLLKQPGQRSVVTVLPNELKFNTTATQKNDLSEMPGFLSGGLTVLFCSEARMFSASIRKMFHLSMFADFIWRNVPETVEKHYFERRYL